MISNFFCLVIWPFIRFRVQRQDARRFFDIDQCNYLFKYYCYNEKTDSYLLHIKQKHIYERFKLKCITYVLEKFIFETDSNINQNHSEDLKSECFTFVSIQELYFVTPCVLWWFLYKIDCKSFCLKWNYIFENFYQRIYNGAEVNGMSALVWFF